METEIQKFKKALNIQNRIVGIFYSTKIPKDFKYYRDTACTALARSFFTGQTLIFGAKKHTQLCSGAAYYLKLADISDKETEDVYINKEQVFKNKNICREFLKGLPEFPLSSKNKFIIIKPLSEEDKPAVVVLLVNPAQAGRILGLINYAQYQKIEIAPSQPTCLSFFAPIATKKPHINFLDYYDRYYQGAVDGKNIYSDNQLIISLAYSDFKKVLKNLNKSPHGNFKPDLTPAKVDSF